MSKDKKKTYLSAYIPDIPEKIKEKSPRNHSEKIDEIEKAIQSIKDSMIKSNRDNLDAMYNIDMDNMSSSLRRLFQSYSDGIANAEASIEVWSNAQSAGFEAVAKWQSEAEESISDIKGTADDSSAQLLLLSQWQSEAEKSIAAIEIVSDQNSAKITSLTNWQSSAEDDISSLSETVAILEEVADENGASISQIVRAVGESGEVTAASIVAAVNDSGSSVMISADKIEMTGTTTFLTAEDVGDDGSTVIAGNRISVNIDGSEDDGATDIDSDNGFNFEYVTSGGLTRTFATMYTNIDGVDTDVTSRYALMLETKRFRNEDGVYVYPAVKIEAAGRVSLKGQNGVYIGTTDTAFITLDGWDNTRIRAYKRYSAMAYEGSSGYAFCTDGIYYNGKLILST